MKEIDVRKIPGEIVEKPLNYWDAIDNVSNDRRGWAL